ncbi:MAG: DUF5118 domain-containing protein, partial [Gemmatimonadaceae bacterium]
MTNKSLTLSAVFLLAACARAPQPSTSPTPQRTNQVAAADSPRVGSDSARGAGSGPAQPRPYTRVITRDARTRRGMSAVHRVNDKLFFEIPRTE